jgi:hypothetical protein
VRPKIEDVVVYDTLCSIDPYIIGNYRFDSTGVYNVKLQTNDDLKCDSIVVLHLEKMNPIMANVSDEYRWVCADDSLLLVDYELVEGARNPFVYSVVFDSLAHSVGFVDVHDIMVNPEKQIFEIPLPKNCRPNHYSANIVLRDTVSACDGVVLSVEFDVFYSSKILESKFDNLITVLSEEENGGYEFDEYKWFRDGELLPNENKSYLYLDGETFASECYYIEVRRVDDGVVMRTCEICPNATPVVDIVESDVNVSATLLDKGQPIVIENLDEGCINIYSFTGQLIDRYQVNTDFIEIAAPQMSGFYLLEIKTSEYNLVYRIYVKDN